jgi:hypothetical protein
MIAFIASLLEFGGMAGLSAQIGSANGPSACPLCCRRRATDERQAPHINQLSSLHAGTDGQRPIASRGIDMLGNLFGRSK